MRALIIGNVVFFLIAEQTRGNLMCRRSAFSEFVLSNINTRFLSDFYLFTLLEPFLDFELAKRWIIKVSRLWRLSAPHEKFLSKWLNLLAKYLKNFVKIIKFFAAPSARGYFIPLSLTKWEAGRTETTLPPP